MRSQQLKLDGLLKLVWQRRWKRRIRLIKTTGIYLLVLLLLRLYHVACFRKLVKVQ